MAQNKKAKKSKTMGKKELKKTKGGLLPAVIVQSSYKEMGTTPAQFEFLK
jgi:hypothetical protein